MGQRHNRRRTRRSSNRNIPPTVLAQHPTSPVEIKSTIRTPQNSFCALVSADNSPDACISRGSPVATLAPSWHYGYTAWQTRERSSRLESNGLEEAQCRLFGGEPGDDVSLCYRMLEYFGGLDYIDSWVSVSFLIHFQNINPDIAFRTSGHALGDWMPEVSIWRLNWMACSVILFFPGQQKRQNNKNDFTNLRRLWIRIRQIKQKKKRHRK